jgi:hypothetical protein
MNSVLSELLGKEVEVRSMSSGDSGTDWKDSGVLEAFDGQWLKLRKGHERLYFPIYNVRLVKPLE